MKTFSRRKKVLAISAVVLIILALMISIKRYKPYYFVEGNWIASLSSEQLIKADTLSIATFNAGILYGQLFKQTVFEPVPFSKERIDKLAGFLSKLDVDVIGLQEIYNPEDKENLIQNVKQAYPYAIYFKRSQLLKVGFNNGMMFLSRVPILGADFEMYDKNPVTEKIVVDKGILSIAIKVNDQRIILSNTHTTAGGVMYHTESDKANQIRTKQIQQTMELTDSLAGLDDVKVILGDFNAGPGVSEVNYRDLIENGYVDSYELGCTENCQVITWAPDNKLNAHGHFPDSPPQRIDHIFIHRKKLNDFKVVEVGVILDKEVVPVENDELVTLSDHYGYFCKISMK
jgi:endonuclease/exonuclease/phosphatase family metal-dependent hydrolase